MEENLTIEQVRATIKSAKDSVTVIDQTIAVLAETNNSVRRKDDIKRNVEHLNIVLERIAEKGAEHVATVQTDLDLLQAGATRGQEKLDADIWNNVTPTNPL